MLLYILYIIAHETKTNPDRDDNLPDHTGITTMKNVLTALMNDECGFIVSAELVLVATIGVLAMIVGLTEVSFAVNQELEDVGAAFGSINQGYSYNGQQGFKGGVNGSMHDDEWDDCDDSCDISCAVAPTGESY
jgi:Flp pilus assembly pilin Flp